MQQRVCDNSLILLHEFKPCCHIVQMWKSDEILTGFVFATNDRGVAWFWRGPLHFFEKGGSLPHWYFDFVKFVDFTGYRPIILTAFKARDPEKIFQILEEEYANAN